MREGGEGGEGKTETVYLEPILARRIGIRLDTKGQQVAYTKVFLSSKEHS